MSDNTTKRPLRGWKEPETAPRTMSQILSLDRKKRQTSQELPPEEPVDNSVFSVEKIALAPVDKGTFNDPVSRNVSEPLNDSETGNVTASFDDTESFAGPVTFNATESFNAAASFAASVSSPALESSDDQSTIALPEAPAIATEPSIAPGSFRDPVSFIATESRYAPEPFNDSETHPVILTSLRPVREKDGFLEIRRGYSKIDWQVYQLMQILTPHEFLVYFDLYSRSFGRVPQRNFCRCVYGDIVAATRIKSKTTVKAAVKKLHEKGLVIPGKKSEGAGEQSYFSVFLPFEAKARLGMALKGKDPVIVPIETPPRDIW